MSTEVLERRFAEMGARVKIREPLVPWRRGRQWSRGEPSDRVGVNVDRDSKGEHFLILVPGGAELKVVDIQPKDRHLLLLTELNGQKGKLLCGHDERHWFVAGVPDTPGISGVEQAKLALQPDRLRDTSSKLKQGKRHRRRNERFKRQGEWFFVPEDPPNLDEASILHNEPLTRSRAAKPHVLEFAYRFGGTVVYLGRGDSAITADEWANLSREGRREYRTSMLRDPILYAKGKVSHADHATIVLGGWHRVEMNTEQRASVAVRSQVMFLD